MRQPLWILNSALALLLIGICILLFVTKPKKIARKQLIPTLVPSTVLQQETPKIDLATIYEKDPFGTISTVSESKPKTAQPIVPPVPTPPMKPTVTQGVKTRPQFLPPLNILLKGVIFSDNEPENRAIIADKKTKTEALYKIGDTLLDAEIIRIESNKIMIMRSNGQQETVFVSVLDAHNDPLYQQIEHAKGINSQAVRQQGPMNFMIDPELFVQNITNLAHFIELLDITTAYEKDHGVGLRIGTIQPGSLGALLGLQTNDIVTSINDIPSITAADRLAIYEQIRKIKTDDTIKVTLLRNNTPLQLTYNIGSFNPRRRVIAPQKAAPSRQPYPVQQQFSTTPAPQPVPTPNLMPPSIPQQILPQAPSPVPLAPRDVRSVQATDKRIMFENGGRSGMLRPPQP